MGTIRLNMSPKEINEGYRAGIPENIMAKMIQGMELIEKEKDFVKSRGKVYVLGHTKYRGQTRIKPQLRDLPGGSRSNPIVSQSNPNKDENENSFKKDVEEVENEYEETKESPAIYGFKDWMDIIDKETYDELKEYWEMPEEKMEDYDFERRDELTGQLEEQCMNYMYGQVDYASEEFKGMGFELINTLSGDYSYDKILERNGKKVRVSTSPHGQDYSWNIQIEEED